MNLYNEDLALTNLSFSYSSNVKSKIQSNMKKNLNIS